MTITTIKGIIMLPRSGFEMIKAAFANLDMSPGSFAFYYADQVWAAVIKWFEEKPRDIRAVFSSKDCLRIIISHQEDDIPYLETFARKGHQFHIRDGHSSD